MQQAEEIMKKIIIKELMEKLKKKSLNCKIRKIIAQSALIPVYVFELITNLQMLVFFHFY